MSSLYTSTGLSSAIAYLARNAPLAGEQQHSFARHVSSPSRVGKGAAYWARAERPTCFLERCGGRADTPMFDVFAAPAEHSYSKTWAELHSNYALSLSISAQSCVQGSGVQRSADIRAERTGRSPPILRSLDVSVSSHVVITCRQLASPDCARIGNISVNSAGPPRACRNVSDPPIR